MLLSQVLKMTEYTRISCSDGALTKELKDAPSQVFSDTACMCIKGNMNSRNCDDDDDDETLQASGAYSLVKWKN